MFPSCSANNYQQFNSSCERVTLVTVNLAGVGREMSATGFWSCTMSLLDLALAKPVLNTALWHPSNIPPCPFHHGNQFPCLRRAPWFWRANYHGKKFMWYLYKYNIMQKVSITTISGAVFWTFWILGWQNYSFPALVQAWAQKVAEVQVHPLPNVSYWLDVGTCSMPVYSGLLFRCI